MLIVLLVGLGACSPHLNAQTQVQHAPTVEQCRADQKLWISKLEQEPVGAGVANVSFNELNAWTLEMRDCQTVDPEFRWQYYSTQGEARIYQLARVGYFLDRHNLHGQFIAEDAQGQGR